ncbi:DinB superfamily protein [Fibrella aquatilis]|uniref:DinB superfamily protein n=1 Tax=Fibrella aquatilis TaxID=2817059 RepID=UPI00286D8C8F|nr:DinB superfamily protein [Fibrella aquatilis]
MIIQTLQTLFRRDLNRLKKEISLYENEAAIWTVAPGIANSAGNLCLHLIGNLNTYIGAEPGKTGYIRNRDDEFSLKNAPRSTLLSQLDDTIAAVEAGLNNVNCQQLEQEYPLLVFAEKTSTGYFLIHLATHLGYHLVRSITTSGCWIYKHYATKTDEEIAQCYPAFA